VIRVEFTEPLGDRDWTKWREDADSKTETLCDDFNAKRAYKISESLYKKMRQVFLDAFEGKCAYCEAKITLDQHGGDVEHFRPKGRVTGNDGRTIMIRARGGGLKPHPGYPWLAYDWRNLLPACRACNQPGKTRAKKTVGKWDRFPVGRFRASAPGEEQRERHLLIHPIFDDPERHLVLDPITGIMGWRTKRGEACVDLLDLNREGLPETRRSVYLAVDAQLRAVHDDLDGRDLDHAAERLKILRDYKRGASAYSWAGRLALADYRRNATGSE
jgi:hypothetical protein